MDAFYGMDVDLEHKARKHDTGAQILEYEMQLIGSAGAIQAEEDRPPLYGSSPEEEREETMGEREDRHAGYMAQAEDAYSNFSKYLKRQDWIEVHYKAAGDIQLWELPVEYEEDTGEAIYAMMASGVVMGKTANEIAKAYGDNNKITRLKCHGGWDADIIDIGDLEHITRQGDISLDIMHSLVWLPPPLANREFVNVQWSYNKATKKNKRDRDWTLIARHCTHPKRPIKGDPVRATAMSGMKLQALTPIEEEEFSRIETDRTHITILGWVRPNGNIPAAVIKLFRTKLADRILWMRIHQFTGE